MMKFRSLERRSVFLSIGIILFSLVFSFMFAQIRPVEANIDNEYPQCDEFTVSKKVVTDIEEDIVITARGSDPDGDIEKIIVYAAAGGQINKKPDDLECHVLDREDDDYSYYCGAERVWVEIDTEKYDDELNYKISYEELMEEVVEHYHRGQRYWDRDYVQFLKDNPNGVSFYEGDDYYEKFDIEDFDPDDYRRDEYYKYYNVYDEDDPEYDEYRYGDLRWDKDYNIEEEGIYLVVNVVGQFEEDICSSNIGRNDGNGVFYNGGKWDKECEGGCTAFIQYKPDKTAKPDEDKDLCGNGIVDEGEECDYKYDNKCTNQCKKIDDKGGTDDDKRHDPIETGFGGNVSSRFAGIVGSLILVSSSVSIIMIVKKRKQLAKELE